MIANSGARIECLGNAVHIVYVDYLFQDEYNKVSYRSYEACNLEKAQKGNVAGNKLNKRSNDDN